MLAYAGVTFPSLQMIISNWVDDDCNSRAISFVYSGRLQELQLQCGIQLVAHVLDMPHFPWHSLRNMEAVQTGSNTIMTASARLCTFAGAMFGAIAAYVTAPFIVESLGWPAVFTVYGMVGFVWVVLWSVLVSEGPLHSHMARPQAAEPHEAPLRIPYKAFATCLPLWAIIIVETSHGGSQVSPTGILSVCQKSHARASHA